MLAMPADDMYKYFCPYVVPRLLNQRPLRLERDIMDNEYLDEVIQFCKRWLRYPLERKRSRSLPDFTPGDIYLDCDYHPVIAAEIVRFRTSQPGYWDADLAGVSMIDGSFPRSCSLRHCAPCKLSPEDAMLIVLHWDELQEERQRITNLIATKPELRKLYE